MLREWGTLFLTFSCAEYELPEIESYLRKVNQVPDSYPVGKLCCKDPLSVSRKFSLTFHALFNTGILKGKDLGQVDHYFFKKEYQVRGAPHYHVALWIRGAPVIGKDQPKKVLDWIQQRITCRLPEEKSNPELHRLVTRYQMHTCSKYCKRKVKYSEAYVTRCKFGFPHDICEASSLNRVDDFLKLRKKIYHLPHTEYETRVKH